MKVTMFVDLGSKEIEVEINGDNAVQAILEGSERWTTEQLVWHLCNKFLIVMREMPNAVIAAQTPEGRKVVGDELEKLLARFRA